jgi:putative effector of murein hydrolase
MLHRASGFHPLVNPVAIAVGLLLALLELTHLVRQRLEGAQFVHFLLGPATVALAVPLWEQARARASAVAAAGRGAAGGRSVGAGSAMRRGALAGRQPRTLLSLAPSR